MDPKVPYLWDEQNGEWVLADEDGAEAAEAPFETSGGPGYDGLAIASLVFGILLCFPASIVAILLGKRAQERIATSDARGAELAQAGIVLGWVGLVLSVVSFAFTIVMAARSG